MPIVPKYREGFPRLDIVQAKAAMEQEQPVCVFTSRTEICGGELLAYVDGEGRLVVDFNLYAEYFNANCDRRVFTMVRAPIRANPDRHLVICPRCEDPFVTLFFNGRWACGDCHRLGFRSQYASKEVLERERYLAERDDLKARFARGKPDGMWQATADKSLRRLADLEAWLEREPMVVASKRHAQVVTGSWMSVEEALRGRLVPERCLQPLPLAAPAMDASTIHIPRPQFWSS